ncbi:MAG: AAA family ATPase [Lachnospiraceae bacterium]|nr:AAA family ATPase [Lachnospiraceae bacterium]
MGRIIAVANQKGGVGKTTTSINLAACLAEKGKKVLAVDMDPQGNLTSGLGVDKNELPLTIYEAMCGECNIGECMIVHPLGSHKLNLSLIPAGRNLAGAEVDFIESDSRQYILKNILDSIKDKYDFIIVDCPPALGILTVNSMTAADTVLVPIQCEFFALDGLSQLIYTIDLIKKKLNKALEIEGVVFTMYDARTNLSLEVVENVKNNLDQFIYKTIIPRNVRLAEAPSFGLPINLYDSRSAGAQGYRDLADEVIKNKLYANL